MSVGMILAYNAAPFLENLYRRIPKEFLDDLILTDDGSTDDTAQRLSELAATSMKPTPSTWRRAGDQLKIY